MLFADLARYNERAHARFAALHAAAARAKSRRAADAAVAAAEHEHLDELQERLDFLTFCLVNAPPPPPQLGSPPPRAASAEHLTPPPPRHR